VGRPKFTPKTAPCPSTINTLSNTPITRPTPCTHHPKRHPDPLSCFATVHFPDDTHTDTHRPIDGLRDRSVRWVLTLAVLIESDALIILLEHPVHYTRLPIASSSRLCRQSGQWQYHSTHAIMTSEWNFVYSCRLAGQTDSFPLDRPPPLHWLQFCWITLFTRNQVATT